MNPRKLSWRQHMRLNKDKVLEVSEVFDPEGPDFIELGKYVLLMSTSGGTGTPNHPTDQGGQGGFMRRVLRFGLFRERA